MKKVIVVEKSHQIRSVITSSVKSAGFEPVVYNDKKAMEASLPQLSGGEFSGVILNKDVGGDCGLDLLESVRQKDGFADVPALLTTAEAPKELVVQVSMYGVRGLLVTPFSGSQVTEKIRKVFR